MYLIVKRLKKNFFQSSGFNTRFFAAPAPRRPSSAGGSGPPQPRDHPRRHQEGDHRRRVGILQDQLSTQAAAPVCRGESLLCGLRQSAQRRGVLQGGGHTALAHFYRRPGGRAALQSRQIHSDFLPGSRCTRWRILSQTVVRAVRLCHRKVTISQYFESQRAVKRQ